MDSRAVFSFAYHPQMDDKTERSHCTIVQAIRCMLAEHSLLPEDWCEVAGVLELGLNVAVSKSTGKPLALMA